MYQGHFYLNFTVFPYQNVICRQFDQTVFRFLQRVGGFDVRSQMDTMTAKMTGKIRNVTCVMQELGYVSVSIEIVLYRSKLLIYCYHLDPRIWKFSIFRLDKWIGNNNFFCFLIYSSTTIWSPITRTWTKEWWDCRSPMNLNRTWSTA